MSGETSPSPSGLPVAAAFSSGGFRLTAVVAATPAGVIGRDGDMPWHLRRDLRRFKRLTLGGVLIMGRRTFDSIGRPLPGRRTVVLTRNREWGAEGVEVAGSPEEAVERVGEERGFVVGGAEIYRQLISRCEEVLLTRVWSAVRGDTHLDLDWTPFVLREITRLPASERDDVPTELMRFVRRKS